MEISEVIRKRMSCRTYRPIPINEEDRLALEDFIRLNSIGIDNERIDFKLIHKAESEKPLKINYGMIQGHNSFILGTSKPNPDSRLNYGYLMEKILLKATELGIATCWVGYFDQSFFKEVEVREDMEIPSIIIVGYAESKQSVGERLVRYAIKAHKRNDWGTLFFNYQTKSPLSNKLEAGYIQALEMLRLAPSSGNSQPWRVYYDHITNEFHFFKKTINKKYDQLGLHEIDLGIAFAHFELVAKANGMKGQWIKLASDKIESIEDLKYVGSWKCE